MIIGFLFNFLYIRVHLTADRTQERLLIIFSAAYPLKSFRVPPVVRVPHFGKHCSRNKTVFLNLFKTYLPSWFRFVSLKLAEMLKTAAEFKGSEKIKWMDQYVCMYVCMHACGTWIQPLMAISYTALKLRLWHSPSVKRLYNAVASKLLHPRITDEGSATGDFASEISVV
jgi:hypothetical protein